MRTRVFLLVLWAICGGLCVPPLVSADDVDRAPVFYSETTPDNSVQRLATHLQTAQATPSPLPRDDSFGYLPALLEQLDIPVSSQVLVFTKTSLQRNRIAPPTPRALYFNDDVYVGYCQQGDVLEVSSADSQLGTVFYTLDQHQEAPRLVRQYEHCIVCHGSSATNGFPGHLVRSVFSDADGQPRLSLGSTRVDHRTPLTDRWGGWYITGVTGDVIHRGNRLVEDDLSDPPTDNPAGLNVARLDSFIHPAAYLAPHSDVVAMLVLEHQAEGHNRLARAILETRIAIYQQQEFDRILARETDGWTESTLSRIRSVCEPLVEYLVFAEQATWSSPIAGTSTFAVDFAARGQRDSAGRSLRDFDLNRQLFRYPLSYLIESESFQRLPAPAAEYVRRRFGQLLAGEETNPRFAHLTPDVRRELREIVGELYPDLLSKGPATTP